jgi:hypothetical protein
MLGVQMSFQSSVTGVLMKKFLTEEEEENAKGVPQGAVCCRILRFTSLSV